MTSNLAAQYAKSMRLHPYGHGFFDPQPSDVVRPGVCGYIDELGQWQPITDLANESTLHAARFSIAKTVVKFKTRKHEWGPKVSEAVRFTKVELDMGASGVPAGIPLEASMLVDYQTTTDFGAILVCPSTVVQEGYYHRNPFSQWAQENASAILKAQPDVKTDGFWIVTSTYAAADIWINAWRSKDHHVTIGFKAGAAAVGEIAPSGEFYRADSASGWIHPLVEVRNRLPYPNANVTKLLGG